MKTDRIKDCFLKLEKENRSAFIAFLTAGDPNQKKSLQILKALPNAGVDIIELGMPFSDPMADGATIQKSYLRSLRSGNTLEKTLELVKKFRTENDKTPIILMGYFNPILQMGINKFFNIAKQKGVDGILVVDMPPEADKELKDILNNKTLNLIRLVTPTTDKERIFDILNNSSGFLYYVSIKGITGSKINRASEIKKNYLKHKKNIDMPFVIGFGIDSPKLAKEIATYSDGVVVGSSIVKEIENGIKNNRKIFNNVINLVKRYSMAIKKVNKKK